MIRRATTTVLFLCLATVTLLVAQGPAVQPASAVPRGIRRDVPMPPSIRRALSAGTRESSGRPGPNYWQLQTDYTINARLDSESGTVFGKETIAIHNTSPGALAELVLRLDHNIYRPLAQRGPSVPGEITDGCVVTALALNGSAIDLAPVQFVPGAAPAPPRASVAGLDQTSARINLAGRPIAAGATATLDIEWHTKLPGGSGAATV